MIKIYQLMIKTMIPCKRFNKLADLLNYKDLYLFKCVVIDEAQFFRRFTRNS